MRVLLLSPYEESAVESTIKNDGRVSYTKISRKVTLQDVEGHCLLISYGYRYIIPPEILGYFNHRCFNLHVGFLPDCPGAGPNVSSWLYGLKKGVTIHELVEEVDAGPIIAQKEILESEFGDLSRETLRTTYNVLRREIETLFASIWDNCVRDDVVRISQNPVKFNAPCWRQHQIDLLLKEVSNGYDTTIEQVRADISENETVFAWMDADNFFKDEPAVSAPDTHKDPINATLSGDPRGGSKGKSTTAKNCL